jgi:hypothetical protein
MYTTKITSVKTVHSQADNNYFIEVRVNVFRQDEEGKPVFHSERAFGYPLDTTKEFIVADLKKLCSTLLSDERVGKEADDLQEKLDAAKSLGDELLDTNPS